MTDYPITSNRHAIQLGMVAQMAIAAGADVAVVGDDKGESTGALRLTMPARPDRSPMVIKVLVVSPDQVNQTRGNR